MDVKVMIIIAFSYIYCFFEVFMNLRQRRRSNITYSDDKKSLWVLYGLITLGYSLSFAIGATKIGRLSSWNSWFAIGVVFIAIGLILRIQSMVTLKQYFTYSIARVDNHPLIQTGPYQLIRHPGYGGQILIFLGIAMALSNWLSVLAMALPIALGYGYRIHVEEQWMQEQFGEDYLEYQKRTKRMIPMIY